MNKGTKIIEEKVSEIERFSGIKLNPDLETGLIRRRGGHYFNVDNESTDLFSMRLHKLEALAKFGIIKKIEINGYKRIAIFIE